VRKTIFILGSILIVGCTRQQPASTAKAPVAPETVSVSHWTDKTELFMEHPPLVAGAKRRFAVHFTSLRTFQPLAKGSVTVRLAREGGEPEVFSVSAPSRPGIFGLDVQPRQAGQYQMTVSLTSPGLDDAHELGAVVVSASEREIPAETEKPKEERIAFLKEQQWSLDFGTALAAEREMRESLRVSGEVRPRSGGDVQVTAPISGRIATSSPIPVIGVLVSRGDEVASLVPFTPASGDRPTLEYAISEATTALDLARRDRERTERLLKADAIPAKRLDEARAAEATATARLAASKERLTQYESSRQADGAGPQFLLRAPISGVVAEVKSSPGANVAQGDSLLRIVAVDEVYVFANVPESDAHRLAQLAGADGETPGPNSTFPASRLVSKSSFIDPQSRTLSVVYEVPNPGRRLAVGESVFVRLFLSGKTKAVTVPESAIVDDGGRPVVFIQHEGESFSRRPVKLGIREGDLVQVTEGLKPGERIVTRGAYLVRLAALSTQIPAHGHVH
jgi:membrane fusion protein, heavy metal efflux system